MVEYSSNAKKMRSSEIRRLMALAADPSVISFAGGMPANDLFPVDIVDELYTTLSTVEKQVALQYGPTAGYPPLLESIKAYLQSRGLPIDGQDVIVTTGAQQAINIVTKVFIDPGDVIVTEYPSFIGAIAAFRSFNAELMGVPIDDDGIILEKFDEVCAEHAKRIKLIYLSPFFHNPAGIIYSEQRKKGMIDRLADAPYCLLEDDPYGELWFDETDKPLTLPIKATAGEAFPICYVGSFAKIFGPGLRLGYLLAPKEIIEKCELTKQSMDACTSSFTQVLAHEYLSQGKLAPYLAALRPIYKRRAEKMLHALKQYMPEGVTWTTPKGGFYVWVTLPEKCDSTEVLNRSLTGGAAFVIGSAFDPAGVKNNTFRLAFSFTPEEKIERGIEIIADAVKGLL